MGQFRFGVVGGLLASPLEKGVLATEIRRLALNEWHHPITGERVRYSFATVERWYYLARTSNDPVQALSGIRRVDKGSSRAISMSFKDAIKVQYQKHPDWTWSLHLDNLRVTASSHPELGECPSYSTFRRYMKATGLKRTARLKKLSPGQLLAKDRLESREIRSFEMEYIASLWHLDFHHGSRRVLNSKGEWISPICLAIHDDHSRLCCHIQWYERETCENLVHGVNQAFLKRGLPRSLMTDNGAAMRAEEFVQGLSRLGIIHDTSLPYAPYQNGKTERFWGVLESRLVPMLPTRQDLNLDELNGFTVSWAEMGYNREFHRELNESPIDRVQKTQDVSRRAPPLQELNFAFRARVSRKQRCSDGTVTIEGIRYEVPSAWRHQEHLTLHVARWNPGTVHIVDHDTDKRLSAIWPCDLVKNSEGLRKLTKVEIPPNLIEEDLSPAPLLQKYLEDFASTGLPMPFLPKNEASLEYNHDE